MNNLDMDLLRAFVRVAETGSFTQAGQMIGASQSAVSLRIKKLEERLGDSLLSRSPRSVRLTSFGARFLTDARNLIDFHDRVALRVSNAETRKRLHFGISDHAAGGSLPAIISELTQSLPEYQLNVSVGLSDELFRDFKAGLFDAVMIRSEDVEIPAQTAFEEDLVWTASPNFSWSTERMFPLVALSGSCAVRKLATAKLKEIGVGWEDVFIGAGVSAVQAAVEAGLGIACLDRRNIPEGCRDVGNLYQLPDLPKTRMALFNRTNGAQGEAVGSAILKAFRQVG
jgi:DNA-binding transcriptional LysR family regulator